VPRSARSSAGSPLPPESGAGSRLTSCTTRTRSSSARERVPLSIIQRQVGHANLGTTSIYLQRIDPEEITTAVRTRRARMMPASRHARRCAIRAGPHRIPAEARLADASAWSATMSAERPLLDGELAAAISNTLVKALARTTGRGPTKAKTTLGENGVFVVLQDSLTRGEQTLANAGEGQAVLDLRRRWQRVMQADVSKEIEQLTGRKVIGFMSDNHIDPDLAVEVFILRTAAARRSRARPLTLRLIHRQRTPPRRRARSREELVRAVQAFETSEAIGRALAGETELERVLKLIIRRSRAARGAGDDPRPARGRRVPDPRPLSGEVERSQLQLAMPLSRNLRIRLRAQWWDERG
jgi:uncharacterized protein YbcI